MYYNWTGPIKIPVPTVLAHKIAYLGANSINAPVTSEKLGSLPYYI